MASKDDAYRESLLRSPSRRPAEADITTTAPTTAALFSVEDLDFDHLNVTPSTFQYEDDPDLEAKIYENDEVKRRIMEGIDIGKYQKEVADELAEIERNSVLEYLEEREDFAKLFRDMSTVEHVLDRVQETVSVFQTELGAITAEIQAIQTDTKQKEIKLENRKSVQKHLTNFVNDVNLPNNLRQALLSGPIDDSYVTYIEAFNSKLKSLKEYTGHNVQAVDDVSRAMRELVSVASGRVFDWLHRKFEFGLQSLTNLAALQTSLIKYKDLFKFLHDNTPEKSNDLVNLYVLQASTLYVNFNRGQLDAFYNLMMDTANSYDMIGTGESQIRNFFSAMNTTITSTVTTTFNQTSNKRVKQNVFSLGTRTSTLRKIDDPIEFPVNPKPDQKFGYEYLFRSVHYRLMVDVLEELKFCRDFLGYDLAEKIFGRTTTLLIMNLQEYMSYSHDVIGMLIMLAIIGRFKSLMNQRKEHGLDQLFTQEAVSIIPRVHVILDMHITSIKTASIDSLGAADINSKRPHYVTRRYAEFAAAVSSLLRDFPEAIGAVKLRTKMVTIREEFDLLLKKLARHSKSPKEQLVFLLNNYDLINSVARERHVKNDDANYYVEEMNRSADSWGSILVSEALKNFTAFINQNTEKSGDQMKLLKKVPSETVQAVVIEFSTSWKQVLTSIGETILSSFPNLEAGKMIRKRIFQDLYVNYRGFVDIVKASYPTIFSSTQLVAVTALRSEIAKLVEEPGAN